MARSGWCIGPRGTRPPHEGCRWEPCTCDCHQDTDDTEDTE